MCGILAMFGGSSVSAATFLAALEKIRHRGPDAMRMQVTDGVTLGFQRLAIVDRHPSAIQPLTLPTWPTLTLLYNGEVYNHAEMTAEHRTDTRCDGEALVWAYARGGADMVCDTARGVFAAVIIDWSKRVVVVVRDPIGVRPLYRLTHDGVTAFGSELRSVATLHPAASVEEFPAGTCATYALLPSGELGDCLSSRRYFDVRALPPPPAPASSPEALVEATRTAAARIAAAELEHGGVLPESFYKETMPAELWAVRQQLITAVRHRCDVADVSIGALLSGGLDSSVVCAIAAAHFKEIGRSFETFSIGLPGSTDVAAAVAVAKAAGLSHTIFEVSEEDCLAALPHVVESTSTWDVTTIRASTVMWLCAQRVRQAAPHIKVVLSGEGADEVCQGYVYFKKAPTAAAADEESRRLIHELPMYDVLRADRSISAHSLELRVPFLAVDFVEAFMALPAELRQPLTPGDAPADAPLAARVEKLALRVACAGLLPWELIARPKEAFSDGVSGLARPWYQVVQERAAVEVTDAELAAAGTTAPHATPRTKEQLWFRSMYRHVVGDREDLDTLIAGPWLPRWCGDTQEASARALDVFVA